ncbi:MAG: hypothetical protein QE263_08000 [Vampirovibrionales bacterium]|nr:hypothetical protein [Vampirovibrionales bacterium]
MRLTFSAHHATRLAPRFGNNQETGGGLTNEQRVASNLSQRMLNDADEAAANNDLLTAATYTQQANEVRLDAGLPAIKVEETTVRD